MVQVTSSHANNQTCGGIYLRYSNEGDFRESKNAIILSDASLAPELKILDGKYLGEGIFATGRCIGHDKDTVMWNLCDTCQEESTDLILDPKEMLTVLNECEYAISHPSDSEGLKNLDLNSKIYFDPKLGISEKKHSSLTDEESLFKFGTSSRRIL